jgi:hypothetical protein
MRVSPSSAALLATLGVVLVALFPLAAGPFTATHGPITALRAIAAAFLLAVVLAFLPTAIITGCEFYVGLDVSPAHMNGCDPVPVLSLRC